MKYLNLSTSKSAAHKVTVRVAAIFNVDSHTFFFSALQLPYKIGILACSISCELLLHFFRDFFFFFRPSKTNNQVTFIDWNYIEYRKTVWISLQNVVKTSLAEQNCNIFWWTWIFVIAIMSCVISISFLFFVVSPVCATIMSRNRWANKVSINRVCCIDLFPHYRSELKKKKNYPLKLMRDTITKTPNNNSNQTTRKSFVDFFLLLLFSAAVAATAADAVASASLIIRNGIPIWTVRSKSDWGVNVLKSASRCMESQERRVKDDWMMPSEKIANRLLRKSDANQFILRILSDSSAKELTINRCESNDDIVSEKNLQRN